MSSQHLKSARTAKGWTQTQAAARLGVSQSYLAMLEGGLRRPTSKFVRRAMNVYGLSPSVLPHSQLPSQSPVNAQTLVNDLATLGYPAFAYLRSPNRQPKNPGDVLLTALAQHELEARVVEALPWLLLKYWDVDHNSLVREVRLQNLQNRLGFVVTLARRLAERAQSDAKVHVLRALEAELEQSRLVREETFGKASLPEPERRWLKEHRPDEARHWNVLTNWSADTLRYVTA